MVEKTKKRINLDWEVEEIDPVFQEEDNKIKEIEEKLSDMTIWEFEDAIEEYILNWLDENMFWDDEFDEEAYNELKEIVWKEEE